MMSMPNLPMNEQINPEATPDLISHLWAEYLADLAQKIEDRQTAGKATMSLVEVTPVIPALKFITFCREYLRQNPVSEMVFGYGHYLIKLTNGKSAVVGGTNDGEFGELNHHTEAIPVTSGRERSGLPRRSTERL